MNDKFNDLHTISLRIASPEKIREWSHGEITKPETINYRTGRSERHGLFDERIFGPERDYECYCKKYRGIKYRGIVCEKCGVEITRSVVRRQRMGHIDLSSPVAHIWMLRGIPSRMSLLLDTPVNQLEKVIYFAGYIITLIDEEERERIGREIESEYKAKLKTINNDADLDKLQDMYAGTKRELTELHVGKILSEMEYHRFAKRYSTVFEAAIGAEAIYELFKNLDLPALEAQLVVNLEKSDKTSRVKMEKRLSLVRGLIESGTKPEWMFITILPVIPPAIRPMVALSGGRHATSDINDLYRRVINRNNRLKKLKGIHAPDVILRNEKRILQEAVDSLIDNSIKKHSGSVAMSQSQRRSLKSLADNLKGKQGLFRQNLLGKRVDYSGRSVIVVGPSLKLDECGLPKYMALELFRPFVISKIIERDLAFNIRGAGKLIEEATPEVWEILEEVIEGRYVMLNRAPTLHRLSIQAFRPKLIEGKAIQLHPLVCSAFNADFDGDQMAVHVPLSDEAQAEARQLIAADKNLLKPQDGEPIVSPSQDIVLGVFWMTKIIEGSKGEGGIYSSPNEAIMAYDFGAVDFRAKINVMGTDSVRYTQFEGKPFETTVGRLLFNTVLPRDFGYVNKEVKKKDLRRIVADVIRRYGVDKAPAVLDKIKDFGYKYVTMSGSTLGLEDAVVPESKPVYVKQGHKDAQEILDQYNEGLISEEERYRGVIAVWESVKKQIQGDMVTSLQHTESVSDMITSGARGNIDQLTQMAGMKGIIVNTSGRQLDFPIIPSYKEGLSPLEYFITTHGSRKGLADTALNTAKAGYLTRRLVDVAQDIVVSEANCKTKRVLIARQENIDGVIKPIGEAVFGRVLAKEVVAPDGTVMFKKGHIVNRVDADAIEEAGVQEAYVRSPLLCDTLHGVCQQCYGLDLGRNMLIRQGEAVGIVAAQAIGEPGTQLTLRTFHAGGVTGLDITTGLPRVEELFERRVPKNPAIVAKANGEVMGIRVEDNGNKVVEVLSEATGKGGTTDKMINYDVNPRRQVVVKKGDTIKAGQLLTDGSANVSELFTYAGLEAAQNYIMSETNKVYELHGSPIAQKHLEVIVRQMFSRRRITKRGDSNFSTGDIIEYIEIAQVNIELKEKGLELAKSEVVPMGISEVSLSTKSWLSSASFQHTTRTLIANAIQGQQDELRGLKENVILGNLIPAGTGYNEDFIEMPVSANQEEILEN